MKRIFFLLSVIAATYSSEEPSQPSECYEYPEIHPKTSIDLFARSDAVKMKEEFIGILKKADPILADVFTMHDYGYEADEIREMLHMEKSTYYYQWKRIRDRWKQYNAD